MGKVVLKEYNRNTGIAKFGVTEVTDIACLPTDTKCGTGSASEFNFFVSSESSAMCQEDAKYYVLNGTKHYYEELKDHTSE